MEITGVTQDRAIMQLLRGNVYKVLGRVTGSAHRSYSLRED
jgi:hypothetical protein